MIKLPKLKYWYHATDIDTANTIINRGYLIPQNHRGDLSLGVFFANTMANAGQWMSLRGRFNLVDMRIGGADRMPAEINMICMRYLNMVKVQSADGIMCKGPKFEVPGVEVFTEGSGKLGFKISNLKLLESYIESIPELKKMIEKELETA